MSTIDKDLHDGASLHPSQTGGKHTTIDNSQRGWGPGQPGPQRAPAAYHRPGAPRRREPPA
eukprot:scaffold406606_cov32-Prasinocladus_malaysianus.AAC.1